MSIAALAVFTSSHIEQIRYTNAISLISVVVVFSGKRLAVADGFAKKNG